MYFCAPCVSRTVSHLMPVGKPAPPRPRSPETFTASTIFAGLERKSRLQTLVAAMRQVVGERQRIDDAAAREGQARLALQERNLFGRPERQRVCAAVEKACGEQARHIARPRPARRRRARWASRLPPSAPARTVRASRCARSRRPSRPPRGALDFRRDLVGADRQRTGIARNEDAGHRLISATIRSARSDRSARSPRRRAWRKERWRTGRGNRQRQASPARPARSRRTRSRASFGCAPR